MFIDLTHVQKYEEALSFSTAGLPQCYYYAAYAALPLVS